MVISQVVLMFHFNFQFTRTYFWIWKLWDQNKQKRALPVYSNRFFQPPSPLPRPHTHLLYCNEFFHPSIYLDPTFIRDLRVKSLQWTLSISISNIFLSPTTSLVPWIFPRKTLKFSLSISFSHYLYPLYVELIPISNKNFCSILSLSRKRYLYILYFSYRVINKNTIESQ